MRSIIKHRSRLGLIIHLFSTFIEYYGNNVIIRDDTVADR